MLIVKKDTIRSNNTNIGFNKIIGKRLGIVPNKKIRHTIQMTNDWPVCIFTIGQLKCILTYNWSFVLCDLLLLGSISCFKSLYIYKQYMLKIM